VFSTEGGGEVFWELSVSTVHDDDMGACAGSRVIVREDERAFSVCVWWEIYNAVTGVKHVWLYTGEEGEGMVRVEGGVSAEKA
jgi:hypothetical protein